MKRVVPVVMKLAKRMLKRRDTMNRAERLRAGNKMAAAVRAEEVASKFWAKESENLLDIGHYCTLALRGCGSFGK